MSGSVATARRRCRRRRIGDLQLDARTVSVEPSARPATCRSTGSAPSLSMIVKEAADGEHHAGEPTTPRCPDLLCRRPRAGRSRRTVGPVQLHGDVVGAEKVSAPGCQPPGTEAGAMVAGLRDHAADRARAGQASLRQEHETRQVSPAVTMSVPAAMVVGPVRPLLSAEKRATPGPVLMMACVANSSIRRTTARSIGCGPSATSSVSPALGVRRRRTVDDGETARPRWSRPTMWGRPGGRSSDEKSPPSASIRAVHGQTCLRAKLRVARPCSPTAPGNGVFGVNHEPSIRGEGHRRGVGDVLVQVQADVGHTSTEPDLQIAGHGHCARTCNNTSPPTSSTCACPA